MSEEKKTEQIKEEKISDNCTCDLPGYPKMPSPTFSTFILSLASSALVQLGEVPDPESGKIQENADIARHSIDTICMLKEKIEKGLDADETRLLEGILYELRMKYIVKQG